MKVLTAAQMREVDRRTQELGIPGLILMENAAHRVVEFIEETFAPLASHRIVVLCGKGNNGGDGLAVARQLFTRVHPRALDVLLATDPAELRGDAAGNFRMLGACGCPVVREITPRMRNATLVIDALLGTGLNGPAAGRMLELIREINTGFPLAKVVAVDLPSGLASDHPQPLGESARADYTVTFTAPKVAQVLPPNCERVGSLRVAAIGSPPELYEQDAAVFLSLSEPRDFARLFTPRAAGANKGDFGHVLVVGGSRGKTGAAAMSGMAALRAGAGLVTVASAESALPVIASFAPELMTEPLPENEAGAISLRAIESGRLAALVTGKAVVALGPGLGKHPETVGVVRRMVAELQVPLIVDADGLNALAGTPFQGKTLILTPHPGEMARLTGHSVAEVQADRVGVARAFAQQRQATVVLKGQRTVTAFSDSTVFINSTGTPAMATGGTGDILTGLIAGLLAQFPHSRRDAVSAAVWLHGRAGEIGAAELGEKSLVATDLLRFLPEAIHELTSLSYGI